MSKRQKADGKASASKAAASVHADDPNTVIIKRVNTRFILTAFGIFAGLGLGVHFLHGFQVESNAGTLKTRPKRRRPRANTKKR